MIFKISTAIIASGVIAVVLYYLYKPQHLLNATHNRKLTVVKRLLLLPFFNVNHTDSKGWSALHWACRLGHQDIAKTLVNSNQKINLNLQDKLGMTPFYWACYEHQLVIIKFLIKNNKIDINLADKNSRTPLYRACEDGRKNVVRLLLTSPRIDITKQNALGKTPLQIASDKGHYKIIKQLKEFEHKKNET
jgi:receptor-interacting serine/threonine-protein kinase 4